MVDRKDSAFHEVRHPIRVACNAFPSNGVYRACILDIWEEMNPCVG